MQMASSQTLLVLLRIGAPRAESVANCLVDGMLFIILQVRSELTAACISFVVMIHNTKHMTNLNTLMPCVPSEVPLDTFMSPRIRKDGMLTILRWK